MAFLVVQNIFFRGEGRGIHAQKFVLNMTRPKLLTQEHTLLFVATQYMVPGCAVLQCTLRRFCSEAEDMGLGRRYTE
jgi:hypothetical protein